VPRDTIFTSAYGDRYEYRYLDVSTISDNNTTGKTHFISDNKAVSQTHVIRFMTKGHYFRKVSVENVSLDVDDQVTKAYLAAASSNNLPAEVNQGPEPLLELEMEKASIKMALRSSLLGELSRVPNQSQSYPRLV
jgi:hypothetical protein